MVMEAICLQRELGVMLVVVVKVGKSHSLVKIREADEDYVVVENVLLKGKEVETDRCSLVSDADSVIDSNSTGCVLGVSRVLDTGQISVEDSLRELSSIHSKGKTVEEHSISVDKPLLVKEICKDVGLAASGLWFFSLADPFLHSSRWCSVLLGVLSSPIHRSLCLELLVRSDRGWCCDLAELGSSNLCSFGFPDLVLCSTGAVFVFGLLDFGGLGVFFSVFRCCVWRCLVLCCDCSVVDRGSVAAGLMGFGAGGF
ncbi:hypothetical protein ACOSP7_012233 [Xanthoceras sorbifolium]